MSTGSFENWAGEISEIGPIYPFVGSEFIFWIIGIALWIVWHIIQSRVENKHYRDEVSKFGDSNSLKKILDKENPERF